MSVLWREVQIKLEDAKHVLEDRYKDDAGDWKSWEFLKIKRSWISSGIADESEAESVNSGVEQGLGAEVSSMASTSEGGGQ